MTVSGVQQSDSVIHIQVSTLFQVIFPFRITEYWAEFPVLYIGPCWLSVLNVTVCTCQSQTPNQYFGWCFSLATSPEPQTCLLALPPGRVTGISRATGAKQLTSLDLDPVPCLPPFQLVVHPPPKCSAPPSPVPNVSFAPHFLSPVSNPVASFSGSSFFV